MNETILCPKCDRRLLLPVEHMGMEVQCVYCEASFVAGETKPKNPPLPVAILVEPPYEASAAKPVRPRRSRPDEIATTTGATKKSPFAVLVIVLTVIGSVVVGFCCLLISRHHEPVAWQPPADWNNAIKKDLHFDRAPPGVHVPERMLNTDEQQQHAKSFFVFFSRVMREQNVAVEMLSFDGDKLFDLMLEQKLIPEAWRNDRFLLASRVRAGILQTSLYRGEHWTDYEIKTVRQPRERELIVVTRHPNRATGFTLHLRWWLAHRDGGWRIQEVEDIDYGSRMSLFLAAGLEPLNPGREAVRQEVRSVRDAWNAALLQNNFDEAARIMEKTRVADLPPACAATFHQLQGWIRFRLRRSEETIASCDAAQRCQPDMPGCDYLHSLALNNLNRAEQALKHARLAEKWYGDDPVVQYEMGLASHKLNQLADAARYYRKVLDADPDFQGALLSLLRCMGPAVQNDDIARRFINMQRPRDQFVTLADDCWLSRDASTLTILAEAMRTLEPRHAEAHFYLALAQAEQDRFPEALTTFRTALDLQNLDARRDYFYTQLAVSIAARDQVVQAFDQLPDRLRSFRALAEALKNSAKMDDLKALVDRHAKQHPNDGYAFLFRACLHLDDEQFDLADRAFNTAFEKITDSATLDRYRFDRIRARYEIGDILGAYRDIGPQREVFRQLADLCWSNKKKIDLKKLVDLHAKNDPNDPENTRFSWRTMILDKRFDDAAKALQSGLGGQMPGDPNRNLAAELYYDMIDAGHVKEAYRHAPNPADAFELCLTGFSGRPRALELELVVEEHRQRFPKDPLLLIHAARKAAAKQEWDKAARAYSEGWNQLPEAKRPRWTSALLYARYKSGHPVQAYRETGQRPEHFRQLVAMILRDKQTELFARLLEAHRPQRANDPEFAAYEARLTILHALPANAADILLATLKERPIQNQRHIADSFLADLGGYDVAAEIYRCIPDKLDAFAQMVWKYRSPERVKEFERLIIEHAKHHPDDPRLVAERAELLMLRNEFAQAEQQFLLAKTKHVNLHFARLGLIRARIKLGKAAEAYRDLGGNALAFQDVAQQCIGLKDDRQLEQVLAAHRQAFPAWRDAALWKIEVSWVKKDYEATVQAILADRARLLKNRTHRWTCESHLVRSLVRLKKPNEAIREAEALNKRNDGPRLLLMLALASTGDVSRVLQFLDTKQGRQVYLDDCYHDEDLGPILRGDAFRELRERFPPPPEGRWMNEPFDDGF